MSLTLQEMRNRAQRRAAKRRAREIINRALDAELSALEEYRVSYVDDDEVQAMFGARASAYSE